MDLMKPIEVDPDFASRKKLAHEPRYPGRPGTAEENIRLHKRTMQELPKHGGKVPGSCLD